MKRFIAPLFAAALVVAPAALSAQEITATINETSTIRTVLNIDSDGFALMEFEDFIEKNPQFADADLETEIPAGTIIKLEI